jgi:hypothetical protein
MRGARGRSGFLVAPPDLTEDSDADRGCTWASEPAINAVAPLGAPNSHVNRTRAEPLPCDHDAASWRGEALMTARPELSENAARMPRLR